MKFFNKDYLYLIWQNPQSRKRFIIGILKRNGKYEFKYQNEAKEAVKEGFELLVPFPDIKKKYSNDSLFPVFASRIPGESRVDIKDILKRYNMDEYNDFELLKRSGGKMPIDNLEFIDPIVNIRLKETSRDFFVAGSRYYCNHKKTVKLNDNVTLERDLENKEDKYAVKLMINNEKIGYMPRYYSKEISTFLKSKRKYNCFVIQECNVCNETNECIKVRLILNV